MEYVDVPEICAWLKVPPLLMSMIPGIVEITEVEIAPRPSVLNSPTIDSGVVPVKIPEKSNE